MCHYETLCQRDNRHNQTNTDCQLILDLITWADSSAGWFGAKCYVSDRGATSDYGIQCWLRP